MLQSIVLIYVIKTKKNKLIVNKSQKPFHTRAHRPLKNCSPSSYSMLMSLCCK